MLATGLLKMYATKALDAHIAKLKARVATLLLKHERVPEAQDHGLDDQEIFRIYSGAWAMESPA